MAGSSPAGAGGTKTRAHATRAYVWGVVALAVLGAAAWAWFFGFSLDRLGLLVGLALGALCATGRFLPISFGVGRASFDVGGVPMLAALVLGGPGCAFLAAAPSAVHRRPSRAAFMGATHALQILAGYLAFSLFRAEPLLAQPRFGAPFVWGTLAAGVAFFGLDALIGPVLMRLKYGLSWREVLEELVLPPLPSDALAVATTLAAALAAASFGAPAALVLLFGSVLSLGATNLVREQRKRTLRLEAENAALGEALCDSNLELARRLVGGLGSRDGHAAAHAAACALYAGDVAHAMGLGEARARQVRLAGLLADVGLLWVPDEILLTRPEKLNSLGRARLERHPVSGEEVLGAVPGLGEVARWIRWHHERTDGTGYPDRLRGEWLPVEAKILAASSHYASLVLDGPHGPGVPPLDARRELVGEAGESLDGEAVKAFLRVLDSNDANYAAAADGRFAFPGTAAPSSVPSLAPGAVGSLRPTGTAERR